jgi:small subunit ribosomal protein S17
MAEETEENVETPEADAVSASRPPAAAPAEILPPKERRRRARAQKAAGSTARPQRSAEERQEERDAERRRKAQVRSARRKRVRDKSRSAATPAAETLAPRREQHPGQQKTRQGIVVSDRASKTIIVRIDVARRHRSYGKVVRTSTTLHAHDEREDAHIGDTVVVRESRPLSRTKRWRLVEVLERAK